MKKPKLTMQQLQEGIDDTCSAIKRAKVLMKKFAHHGGTEGMKRVVKRVPKALETLEKELRELEQELKKSPQ